jgi:hypothetical protein
VPDAAASASASRVAAGSPDSLARIERVDVHVHDARQLQREERVSAGPLVYAE